MLDPDRRSRGGAVTEFSVRYLSCIRRKFIRVSPRTVPRDEALTIKLDRLIEIRRFSLAGENHLNV